MAEIITELEEEELTRRLKSKRRIRGLLIVINFLLLGYLVFCIGNSVLDIIESSKRVDGIVALTDRNQKDSLEIYRQYVNEDNTINCDFAIYGDEIIFTKNHFSNKNLEYFDYVQLMKIETNKKDAIKDISLLYEFKENSYHGNSLFYNSLNSKLAKGDYLFFVESESISNMGKVLKVDNGLDMKYVMYSFPNEQGQRVKATLYAYSRNPALVLNIDYVTDLPENYIDVAIIGENAQYEIIKDKFNGLKVQQYATLSEEEAFALNTNYIVKIIDDDLENPDNIVYAHNLFTSNQDFKLKDDEFIYAMSGYANSEGLPHQFMSEHFMGKRVYLIDLKN